MYFNLNDLPDTRVPKRERLSLEQGLRVLAFHELGHALVGMTRGMSVQSVWLISRPLEDRPGTMQTGGTTWNVSFVGQFDFAVQCEAGGVAEAMERNKIASRAAVEIKGATHDRDRATAVATQSGYQIVNAGRPKSGTTWKKINKEARAAVSRLLPKIAVGAEALLAAPGYRLTGGDVASVTGIPNPAPSDMPESGR